jgi:hypothetical protein
MAMTTASLLAVLAEEVDAEFEVRAAEVAIDGLADVVHERRARRDRGVEADLARHDAGEVGHFLRVVEHVLTVARAELQLAHQPHDFQVQVEQAELEGGGLALLERGLLHLGLHLLDDLLDARRVDAAVGDEPLDGLPRDLAAVGIEAREDDRARACRRRSARRRSPARARGCCAPRGR